MRAQRDSELLQVASRPMRGLRGAQCPPFPPWVEAAQEHSVLSLLQTSADSGARVKGGTRKSQLTAQGAPDDLDFGSNQL